MMKPRKKDMPELPWKLSGSSRTAEWFQTLKVGQRFDASFAQSSIRTELSRSREVQAQHLGVRGRRAQD